MFGHNGNAVSPTDSRLHDPKGTRMAEWTFEEVICVGGVFRIVLRKYRFEMEPVFCFNCGKSKGWVPRGIFSWFRMFCDSCADEWGADPVIHRAPDQDFWDAVRHEMIARFGRALSQDELNRLAEKGELGRPLDLLDKESPLRGK